MTMLNKVQASQQVCCQTRELAAYHWDSWRFSETLLYLRRKSASSMCLDYFLDLSEKDEHSPLMSLVSVHQYMQDR